MLALSVLVAGSSVAPAVAQGGSKSRQEVKAHKERGERRSPEERAAARTERMTKELGLNKAQARKVEALYLKQAKDKDAMRSRFKKGDRNADFRKEMMASHKRHNEELKSILDKKQYAKYEEQREQMKAKHQERGGKDRRGHHERSTQIR